MMVIYSQMIIPLFPYGSGYSIVPPFITGWWLSHPSEKYEFVSWDDYIFPIYYGK